MRCLIVQLKFSISNYTEVEFLDLLKKITKADAPSGKLSMI